MIVGALVGRALVAGSRAAQGALRRQRDHHDADDELSRHEPRECADQARAARSRIPRCRRPAASPVDDRLPRLFGTTIHCGLVLAVVAVILRAPHDDAHGVRAETAGARRQSRRGGACGLASGTADDRRLRARAPRSSASAARSRCWAFGARCGQTGIRPWVCWSCRWCFSRASTAMRSSASRCSSRR